MRVEESQEVSEIFQKGQEEAKNRGHHWFEAEHILIALYHLIHQNAVILQ